MMYDVTYGHVCISVDKEEYDSKHSAGKRMRLLIVRRKLIDLAKIQNEEIKILRAEVERLRKRTFASFPRPRDMNWGVDQVIDDV